MMKKQFRIILFVFLLGCLVFGVAEGVGAGDDDRTLDEFRRLERDIPSLYLINGLYLSQGQAEKLAELLDSARKIEEKYSQKYQKTKNKRQKDVDKVIDDIVATASKQSKMRPRQLAKLSSGRRLRQTRQELAALRRERDKKLNDLADRAYAILTESQRNIVDNFVPCFIPPSDFRNPERVGQAAGDTSFVEPMLVRLRRVPDDQRVPDAVERALDRLVPYAMQKRHMQYSEEAEQSVRDELFAGLESAVARIRKMDDADFELEKETIAAEVLPLHTEDQGRDPRAVQWKVRQYVLNTGILDILQARAGGGSGKVTSAASTMIGGSIRAGGLSQAIRTAVLLKGLNLTDKQAANLLTTVRNAINAKDRIQQEIIQVMKKGLEQHNKLRNELASGHATREGESGANRCHYSVKRLYEDTLTRELLKYEAETDQSLTAHQVDYLSGKLTVPDRRRVKPLDQAGRAKAITEKRRLSSQRIYSAMESAKHLISKARRMSSIEFSSKKDALCKAFINEIVVEQGLEPNSFDIESETRRAGEILDRARQISDIDYRAEREDLAAELCPKRSKSREPTYGAKYVRGMPVQMLGPSTRLLFSETACSILEKMCR